MISITLHEENLWPSILGEASGTTVTLNSAYYNTDGFYLNGTIPKKLYVIVLIHEILYILGIGLGDFWSKLVTNLGE